MRQHGAGFINGGIRMATQAMADEGPSFSIGTVLGRAFGTLGSNPVATFGIAFLFGAVPQALYSYFIGSSLAVADRGSTIAVIAVSIAAFIVFMLLSTLVQGALVRATLAHAKGEKASFGACIGTGLSMAVPLIGLTLLIVLGLFAGFMLLLVPGIMLFIMWSVAAPALVAEESGVFAAFGRSRYLTKGARWRIFGLEILMMILLWLVSGLLGVLMITGGMMPTVTNGAVQLSPTYLALSAVTNTIFIALWSVVHASLYTSLRNWKDGPQSQDLADIFA